MFCRIFSTQTGIHFAGKCSRCYFFFAACFFAGAWVRAEALTDLVCLGITDLGCFMPFDAIEATFAEVFSFLAILLTLFRKCDC